MKRIAIIGTVGIPAKYGGFETLAQHLAFSLKDQYALTVYCSKPAYAEHPAMLNSIRLVYIPLKANGLQSILYDFVSILSAVRKSDIILVLGVSGAIILPFIRFFTRRKIITHIDGLEWKRDKWNGLAKKFLHYSEKLAVKYSHRVIADNKGIEDYVTGAYNTDAALIEYGADHINTKKSATFRQYGFSVCRIEPENNVHVILEAYAGMKDHELIFVGNWEVSQYAKDLYARYTQCPNIQLLAPIYDQDDLARLRNNCKVYLHGHSAGGTNPSLVEAMFASLPVLAFDVEYNRYTTENKAYFFKTSEEIRHLICHMTNEILSENAVVMGEIAQTRYRWETIVRKYADLFDNVTK